MWGRLKFCGDYWKCTSCNNALTRGPEVVYKEAMEMADLIGKDLFVPKEEFNGGVD